MEDLIASVLRQFGFSAAMCLLMLWGFYKFLRWFMEQSEKREVCYREIIDRQTLALDEHTSQAKDFHNEVKTAHEFQRSEHKQIADILKGIEEAVSRINGYTKPQ